METSPENANETVKGLAALVHELEHRIEVLERRGQPAATLPAEPSPVTAAGASTAPEITFFNASAFAALGKVLMVFAGAYVLRALAESGALPQALGVAAGLAYAIFWLLWSARPNPQDGLAVALYAAAASILFPALLWENTVIAPILPVAVSALLAGLFVSAGLLINWPGNRPATAWAATISGLAAALALMVATRQFETFSIALCAIAGAVEFGAIRNHWIPQRWFVALACNFAIFAVIYRSASVGSTVLLPFALAVIYSVSIAWRTIHRGQSIEALEIGQAATAFSLLLSNGLIANHTRLAGIAPGLFLLLCGIGCYIVVIRSGNISGQPRNAAVLATCGLVLVIAGLSTLVSPFLLTVCFCAMAAALTFARLPNRFPGLELQIPIYLLGASLASGLLMFAGRSIMGSAAHAPSSAVIAMLVSCFSFVCCLAWFPKTENLPGRLAATLVAAGGSWGLIGLLAGAVARMLVPDPGLAGALRIGIFSGYAVALALIGRRWNRIECSSLVYPLMAFAGYRLMVHDLNRGRPATLALSLVLYGLGWLVLPRVLKAAH